MKVVEINAVAKGSTGTIMRSIAATVREHGGEAYTFSAAGKPSDAIGHACFGSKLENLFHRVLSVCSGISGTGSVIGTFQLLKKIDRIHPDVIHLHNLHGWYIHLPLLFNYLRKNKVKVVWTLHDCWGFTAQCSHFTMEKCEKWRTGCNHCPRYKIYPYTFVDRTSTMWKLKRRWFSGLKDIVLITPSQWLAELTKRSFLGEYAVKVIRNGIDLSVFKPTASVFRQKYHLDGKYIVLGVSSAWGYAKGLDVFIELAQRLDNRFQIILVGTNMEIDKVLPPNIISIHKTNNQEELVKIYSSADVFVNPTREENYPTVNLEALACGTPVVTFQTGGSPESLTHNTGYVVPYGDFHEMLEKVTEVCVKKPFTRVDCVERAKAFDQEQCYKKYMQLYEAAGAS